MCASTNHYLPSEVKGSVSLTCQLSIMSHSRMVRSHEALARMDWTGLKHRQLTGPSWPPRTYSPTGRKKMRSTRTYWNPSRVFFFFYYISQNKCYYVHTSSSLPVCMDQRKISKESWAPALTSSPLTSTAREENCAGRGDVNVRKFRYL